MAMLWDMHVHLDFMRNVKEIADDAASLNLGLFGVTVTPQGYLKAQEIFFGAENVRLGVGLHPWWAADGRCRKDDAQLAADLARKTRFVGEIGLDASPKHVPEGSLPQQVATFETICMACAQSSDPEKPKVVSLHSVKAGSLTLDILERTGCLEKCRCIFHWFTGSSDELNRAVRSGCMFSVNEMMLRTRRGREYVRQLPPERLLIETDLPPGEDILFSADEILTSINRALEAVEQIKGCQLRTVIIKNSERLFT